MLTQLPAEIIILILSRCNLIDLNNVSLVCKQLYHEANREELFQFLYDKRWNYNFYLQASST